MSDEQSQKKKVLVQDVIADDDGRPVKFSVSGGGVIASQVQVMEARGGKSLQDVEFTLNGDYSLTPHNTYSRIHQGGRSTSPRDDGKELLSYQVLLVPLPRPKGELTVLRLHNGSIKQSQIKEYGLSEDDFEIITETEPAEIFKGIRSFMEADVPDFVLYARRGMTN